MYSLNFYFEAWYFHVFPSATYTGLWFMTRNIQDFCICMEQEWWGIRCTMIVNFSVEVVRSCTDTSAATYTPQVFSWARCCFSCHTNSIKAMKGDSIIHWISHFICARFLLIGVLIVVALLCISSNTLNITVSLICFLNWIYPRLTYYLIIVNICYILKWLIVVMALSVIWTRLFYIHNVVMVLWFYCSRFLLCTYLSSVFVLCLVVCVCCVRVRALWAKLPELNMIWFDNTVWFL